jgi:hypothetical protein
MTPYEVIPLVGDLDILLYHFQYTLQQVLHLSRHPLDTILYLVFT